MMPFPDFVAIVISGALVITLLRLAYLHLGEDWRRIREPSVKRKGKIVEYTKHQTDGGPYYAIKVRFKDASSTEREFVDERGSFPWPNVGDEISVIYPVANPDRARVPHPLSRAVTSAILLAIAALVGLAVANRLLV